MRTASIGSYCTDSNTDPPVGGIRSCTLTDTVYVLWRGCCPYTDMASSFTAGSPASLTASGSKTQVTSLRRSWRRIVGSAPRIVVAVFMLCSFAR